MTRKLTREQLHERARENVKALKMASRQTAFESAREEILADLQLAELVLAAMDSEPVAYSLIFRNMDGALNNFINTNTTFSTREQAEVYGKGGSYEERSDGRLEWVPNPALDPVVVPLYRHTQPAPVVPDEKPVPNPLNMYAVDAVAAIAEVRGWNACRAAMLQAGNSPVIPDGYVIVPKEPTDEMISSGIAAHYDRSQIQIHDRPAPGPMECAYVAMLAAAPHDTPALNSVQSVVAVPGKWIPASERMPDENAEQQVLACFKGGDISTLYYFEGRWDDAYGIVPIRQDVTHWMPLPAAPQEEKP